MLSVCPWGGYTASQAEYNVVKAAYDMGIIIIAGAGNDKTSKPFYPAAYGELINNNIIHVPNRNLVIAVASIDADKTQSIWGVYLGSNYGQWVDISTYGTNLYSTQFTYTNNNVFTSTYGSASGTSFAAPLVSSVVGMLRSFKPNATHDDIISCIINSANHDIYGSLLPNNRFGTLGRGRLDALAAMNCINSDCPNPFAYINSSGQILCPNGVHLDASVGQSYLWSTSATTQGITVSQPGMYSVTINYGTCSSVASIEVEELPEDIPNITVIEDSGQEANDNTICLRDHFYMSASWGNGYKWTSPLGPSQNHDIQIGVPMVWEYTVTITDVGGCIGLEEVLSTQITVTSPPAIAISIYESSGTHHDGTVCSGETAKIYAEGGESYLWSTGATTNFIVVQPTQTTTYSLTVTDQNSCTAVKNAYVFVTPDCQQICGCPNSSDNVGNNDQSITYLSDLLEPVTGRPIVWPSHCMSVKGTLIVDAWYHFEDVLVLMDEGAAIRCNLDGNISISNSHFKSCTERLWKGITLESYGTIRALANVFEDAENAIILQNRSYFTLRYNDFKNNYVGILVPNEGANAPVFPINISLGGNVFTYSRNLKQPFEGHAEYPEWEPSTPENPTQKPFAGIVVNKTTGLLFDPNSLYYTNTFSNIRNGIIANNTSLHIQNIHVKDLAGTSSYYSPSGYGVILNGGMANKIENSLFSNMKVGIHGMESAGVSISDNTFVNFISGTSSPARGILLEDHLGATIVKNDFTNASYGIQMNENSPAGNAAFTISNNLFKLTSNTRNFRGIDINFVIGADNEGSSIDNNKVEILANASSLSGIKFSESTGIVVHHDTVQFSVARTFGTARALELASSNKIQAWNNRFYATNSSSQSVLRSGIYGFHSAFNIYSCNVIYHLDKAVDFSGACDGTILNSTQIGNNLVGLHLTAPTTLYDQIDEGNLWQGSSYVDHAAITGPTEYIQSTAEASTFVTNPTQNQTGALFQPTDVNPGQIKPIWFPNTTSIASTCPTIANPNPNDDGGNLISSSKGKTFNTSAQMDIYNWLNQRSLYFLLQENQQLLSLHSSIDSFYDANANSNIHQFDTIQRIISKGYMDESTMHDLDSLLDIVELLHENIDHLVNGNTAGLDSFQVVSLLEVLYDELVFNKSFADSLVSLNRSQYGINLAYAQGLNDLITTNEDYEEYQQKMYELIMKVREVGIYELDNDDYYWIEEFAFACPELVGKVGVQAQALLQMYLDTTISETLCDDVDQQRMMVSSEEASQIIAFTIFPNPTNTGWNINVWEEGNWQYGLYSASGILEQNHQLSVGRNFIHAPSSPGLYLLRITTDNGSSKTYKLSVIR